MIIPEVGRRINYKYYSSLVTMNIVMTVSAAKHGCKYVTIEGPFIGKYFAITSENESEILLLAFGKGLYYGEVTKDLLRNPLFRLDKSSQSNRDIPIGDKYILSQKSLKTSLKLGNKEYKDCIVMNLIYDKGSYTICVKEEIGLVMIQNVVNNIIKDEIRLQEA